MTKTQENQALDMAKNLIQSKFTLEYGFAPSKNQIVPLEASYEFDSQQGIAWCNTLGFRVGRVGYCFRCGQPLEKAECYNA